MTKKNAIKVYEPTFLCEYGIWYNTSTVKIPVSSLEEMFGLRKTLKKNNLDLELDDQVISHHKLVRFFAFKPKNDTEYILSRIEDELMRTQLEAIRKKRAAEFRACNPRILWSAYQREVLSINEPEQIDDVDQIIERLLPLQFQS